MSSLALHLDADEIEPGDPITGRVVWTGAMTSFEVTLRWVTSGKGDKDESIVAQTVIFVEGIEASEARFELKTPLGPFSFSGKLITLSYFVRVEDTAGEHGQMEAQVMIAPGGKEIELAGA